jgi:prevent-host-death family protein
MMMNKALRVTRAQSPARDEGMSISLTEDFKTAAELQQDPEAVLAHVKKTGRPVVITREGKPGAVMLPVAEFERLIHTINLARLLLEGQDDICAGRTRPLDEWMKEFERANKLPRRNRQQRQR